MDPLQLRSVQSFYVGGTPHRVKSALFGEDTVISGPMYVQHWVPVRHRFHLPVIFIHGGMHTGVTWETTPDGREGWQTLFARSGFETLIVDQAWRGRSAPDLAWMSVSGAPPPAAPPPVIAGIELARRFARGGTRFPADSFRVYASQLWPDFGVVNAIAAGTPGLSDPRALPPLLELIDRFDHVALVTHSQGADLGWKAAIARPKHVAAIVAVEPALTCPGLDDPDIEHIPVRVMWGDNLPSEARTLSLEDLAQARALAAKRRTVTVDWLPEHGIAGNGHMLMMEDNNQQLAARVMDWFVGLRLDGLP